MAASIERKLTTIFSADFAGYSRLMGQDEVGTLATLKAYRESMAQLIADSRGRIVSTAGDGMLVEFASVVEAVACAVNIQRELAERNAALSAERKMRLRIGINLGDVLVENGDLYGDGVNVAARLQSLADPDGILVSGTVFDHVKDKLTLGFDYLGPQAVKNITAPVPIYRVLLQPGAVAPADHREPAVVVEGADANAPGHDRRLRRFYVSAAHAGAVIALLLTIDLMSGGGLWFQWPTAAVLFLLAMRAIQIFRF